MANTTLDSAWFAANPGPPWVLSANGTMYQLAVDVDVPSALSSGVPGSGASYGGGELFKLTGTGSAFDRNGHHIRQNGQDISQRTRSGPRPYGPASEDESPTLNVDNLGGRSEWEVPQDDGDRQASDTGGHVPNTETSTGQQEDQPHGGTTQTGR